MDLLGKPWAWLLVVLFSLIGALTALVYYYVGRRGYEAVASRFPQVTPERWERVHGWYDDHGVIVLLLSALPGLGLLVTTAAGAFAIGRYRFLGWVLVAKLTRNWLLLLLAAVALRQIG
jgi:membrane protein YqaA with SNARE-associated domain